MITTKSLDQIKQDIIDNKWITLYSCGFKHVGDWTVSVPKEADVQTCNIISIVEDEEYQERLNSVNIDRHERLKIIEEIEKYKFNFKMRAWFKWNTSFVYIDNEYEHQWLSFNKEFLQKILLKCKEFKCKHITEE